MGVIWTTNERGINENIEHVFYLIIMIMWFGVIVAYMYFSGYIGGCWLAYVLSD